MKLICTVLILTFSSSIFAAEVQEHFRPTDRCLAKINEAMKPLGKSQIASENEIDFEGFLEISNNRYTFMYYKQLAGGKTLDITGIGSVDLTIKATTEFQGLTDIEDCDVSNAKILEENID